MLTTLTQRTGLSREESLYRLSRDLPQAIDRFTPDGRAPAKQSGGSTAARASVTPSPGHGGTDAACRRSLRGSSLLEGCANGRASGCGSRRASRLPDRGGGPAGLTAALYLARFERRFLVIDAGDSRASWILTSYTECMEWFLDDRCS
ncbi:YidB family protein [Methylorubrum extorquens]|uniref:YidB family protein n=1 Tax=Methylorubrum extorquens TaxID=408 RepID=UPI0035A258FF